jgi:hypothetical protein
MKFVAFTLMLLALQVVGYAQSDSSYLPPRTPPPGSSPVTQQKADARVLHPNDARITRDVSIVGGGTKSPRAAGTDPALGSNAATEKLYEQHNTQLLAIINTLLPRLYGPGDVKKLQLSFANQKGSVQQICIHRTKAIEQYVNLLIDMKKIPVKQ